MSLHNLLCAQLLGTEEVSLSSSILNEVAAIFAKICCFIHVDRLMIPKNSFKGNKKQSKTKQTGRGGSLKLGREWIISAV